MSNGIKMSDCKFYTDEEAGTVVCVIPNTRDLVLDFIWDHFQWADVNLSDALDLKLRRELRMPKSFMGKAKCAAEDDWDEETGKLIAFSRAKDKCYKSFFKRANMYVQTLDRRLGDMISAFNDFGLKLENKRDALQDQIEERMAPATTEKE